MPETEKENGLPVNEGYLETDIDEVVLEDNDTIVHKLVNRSLQMKESLLAKSTEDVKDQEIETAETSNEPLWSDSDLDRITKEVIIKENEPENADSNEPSMTELSSKISLKVKFAIILFFPLGWYAYKMAKEAKAERKQGNFKAAQSKQELAGGISNIAIGCGIACILLFIFVLSFSLHSYHWEPSNIRKLCSEIELDGFTNARCTEIDS